MSVDDDIAALKETTAKQALLLGQLRDAIRFSVPVGTIVPFSSATMTGELDWYLPADGRLVPPDARYATLRALLGDTFRRVDDPSGTCRVPDLSGRAPIGDQHSPGLVAHVVGETLGEESHVLTLAEMPSHAHGGATGNNNADHSHGYKIPPGDNWGGGEGDLVSMGHKGPRYNDASTTGESAPHQHGIGAEGGGSAHNNMQPSLVVRYLVKAVEPSG